MINLFLKTLKLSRESQERLSSIAIPMADAWVCLDCDTIFTRIKEECPACCSKSVTRLAPFLSRDGGRVNADHS